MNLDFTIKILKTELKEAFAPLMINEIVEQLELLKISSLSLGEQIRYWRKKQKLSQKQLSEKCGWGDPKIIGNIENESYKHVPGVDRIQKISTALNVSLVINQRN